MTTALRIDGSYRIAQPELLLTRSGGVEKTQPDMRVATGIVHTFGRSVLPKSSGRRVSFGLVGGVSLTDGFGQESASTVMLQNGMTGVQRSRWESTSKEYIVGPMVEFGLWSNLALEIDALYRSLNYSFAIAAPGERLQPGPNVTVVTWEFPILAKYRFHTRVVTPFVELGPSFRSSGNPNGTAPSIYGGTAGIGVGVAVAWLKLAPLARYTHWAADGEFVQPRTKRNQVELLLELSF